jgi:tetratricopeptide (TPR) repeat protein
LTAELDFRPSYRSISSAGSQNRSGRTLSGDMLYSVMDAPFMGMIAGTADGKRWSSNAGVLVALVLLIFTLTPTLATAQSSPAAFEELAADATAAREQNDVSRAIELYGRGVQSNPKWADGWWFLGSLQYGSGAYAAARDALSQYIDLTPSAAPALAMRGLCEFETGEFADSLKDIQRGLSMGAANQPRNGKILRYHEALLLTRAGRFEEALRSFAFFAHDPDPNPELVTALGLAGLRVPILPKDLRADRQDLYASAGKAALDYMKGDDAAARADFQLLFERFPTTPNAHYLYGYLLYATDPDAAVVELKRELEVNPSNPAAEVMLAWIPLMQNHAAEALPYAQKAVAEDPKLPSAQLVIGRALSETGDPKDGIEHLEKTELLQPDDLEVHLALARAYSAAGRKEDARRERLLCLEMTKNETTLALHP